MKECVRYFQFSFFHIVYMIEKLYSRIGYKKLLGCDTQQTTSQTSICKPSKSVSESTEQKTGIADKNLKTNI